MSNHEDIEVVDEATRAKELDLEEVVDDLIKRIVPNRAIRQGTVDDIEYFRILPIGCLVGSFAIFTVDGAGTLLARSEFSPDEDRNEVRIQLEGVSNKISDGLVSANQDQAVVCIETSPTSDICVHYETYDLNSAGDVAGFATDIIAHSDLPNDQQQALQDPIEPIIVGSKDIMRNDKTDAELINSLYEATEIYVSTVADAKPPTMESWTPWTVTAGIGIVALYTAFGVWIKKIRSKQNENAKNAREELNSIIFEARTGNIRFSDHPSDDPFPLDLLGRLNSNLYFYRQKHMQDAIPGGKSTRESLQKDAIDWAKRNNPADSGDQL